MFKKIRIPIILSLVLSLFLTLTPGFTFAASTTYPNGFTLVKAGDILITNNTSSNGLTGHAGIVVDDSGNIASIAGYGYHPALQSLSTWFKNNPNTVVIRHKDYSTIGSKAGAWAKNYVSNYSNASYSISAKLQSFDLTYCSKIVWQAYFYGAFTNLGSLRADSVADSLVPIPYNIKNWAENNKYGLSVLLTFGNW